MHANSLIQIFRTSHINLKQLIYTASWINLKDFVVRERGWTE